MLKDALNNLNQTEPKVYKKTKCYTLNPKAVNLQELYGFYNPETETSVSGVFSYLMDYLCNKEESPEEKWICFDGPIDTKWIESMNSLLDDNKVLTLLDGNRINLHPLVKLVFVVEDLMQASPATVSRCGMLYLDADRLDWNSIRYSWVSVKEKQGWDNDALDTLEDLFDKWVEPILLKRTQNMKDIIHICDSSIITSFVKMLDAVCTPENGIDYEERDRDDLFWVKYEKHFIFCVIWTLGCALDEDSRKAFDYQIRDIESVFPFSQTVFDYYLNLEKNEFALWEEKLTNSVTLWGPPKDQPHHKFLVQTADTARNRSLISTMLRVHRSMLAVGTTGTGKTALVNYILQQLDDNAYSFMIINLSAQTTSNKLQEIIESKLNRTTKKKYRPFNGKKAVIFIDDLNMPKKDEFGFQPPIELIRQYMEYGSWYDRANLELLVEIKDTELISAMSTGGGGRNTITSSLTHKFHVVNMGVPTDNQMKRIFISILHYKLSDFDSEEIKPHIESVANLIIGLFKNVCNEDRFKPTPMKSHYLFNMRDMSRVIQGMCMIDKFNCDTTKVLQRLLIHECQRIFSDRLIDVADRNLMKSFIDDLLDQQFQQRWHPDIYAEGEDDALFLDFLEDSKIYSECGDIPRIKAGIEEKMILYNRESLKPLNIVLFNQAVVYCCIITRMIKLSNGHGLLVGEGGSGRHSLTMIASYLAKYETFQIIITKGYGANAFKKNMKELFEHIAVEKQPTTFIFSDNEIMDEGIIEDVNNILSLGEIPNLFVKRDGKDEFAPIKEQLKKHCAKETDEVVYEYFVQQIQTYLHVVFCMSQNGPNLRNLGRQYPGIINNTTCIWFDDWPTEALYEVAHKYLHEIEFDNTEVIEPMADFFGLVHSKVIEYAHQMKDELKRTYFVTPKNYIDFVKAFQELLDEKRTETRNLIEKYTVGLDKLD